MTTNTAERAAEIQLQSYRLMRLLEMGFTFRTAEKLSESLAAQRLDWHYVQRLLDGGCPLNLVKKIVL